MDYLLEEKPDSSWLLLLAPPAPAVLPSISFAGLDFIQVEADAWIDGALGQSHGGSDEVFIQVSDNLRLEGGTLSINGIAVATFNKNAHLAHGAYGELLTDG